MSAWAWMAIIAVAAGMSACATHPEAAAGGNAALVGNSASGGNAAIPFAALGNIYDWAADGDRGLYIQALNKQWYYAKLLAPCINLPFATRIGFVSEPTNGQFDKFSSIVVEGQVCPVQSLRKSTPPPSTHKRWRRSKRAAAGAPGH